MRRPLWTILASFVLISNLLGSQDRKPEDPGSRAPSTSESAATVVSLLEESHTIGEQLPVSSRLAYLLPRQAQMVSRLRPDLAQEWANELLTLSAQAKGAQRSIAQNAAIRMLVRLNPDRALDALHRLQIEEPMPKWATSPPEMQLVQEVFEILAERDGTTALPLLGEEAERLGDQGHYPYAALGSAAIRTTAQDWGHDNERAIAVLQSVFEPAFGRYRETAHGYADDLEFGKMLQVLAGGLPMDTVRPALRMLVKNLLATDTNKYQFEAQVYTSDGQTAKVHNAVDATLLFFGTLINRDPELASHLEATRPELQMALEYAKFGRERSMTFGPARQPRNREPADPEAETGLDAVRLSSINAEEAIAKAEQLPDDDKRTSTLLEVARGIAGDYPERAAELIAESQTGNKATDDQLRLNIISAQAFVAAAESRKGDLDELLQRGFELANRVLLEQQRTGAVQIVAGLGPLVQIGIQNDPNLTVAFIEDLPPSYLKAALLLGAASALSMQTRLPFRTATKNRKLPGTVH